MTRIWSTVIGSLLVAQGLVTGGRAQNRGINTQTERVLIAVSEMGHSTTSFEKQDDPTIDKNPVPAHEAKRAARKAAENGDHLAKQKKHEEAMAKYREALSIDPLYYEAANNLALELEAAGNTAEAESTFRHLMQSTPEHVLAFTNLAIMLCAAHRYAEAEAVF
jgi:Flp pilus assembly protein TadD